MQKSQPQKIRRHAWPLVWILVVPLMLQGGMVAGVVGYFSYQSGQRDLATLAEQLREQTHLRIRDHLNASLAIQKQALQSTVAAIQQGQIDINNKEQLRQFLWQQILIAPQLSFINFASERGEEIGYGRLQSQAVKQQVDKLTNKSLAMNTPFMLKRAAPNWISRTFYLVDNQGKPLQKVYSMNSDTRKLSWYQEARRQQGAHWSSPYVSYVVPSLHISANFPLYDAQGRFLGVLSNPFPLSDLNTFIQNLDFSPSGQAFILDPAGHLLTSPDNEPLFYPFQPTGKVTPTLLKAVNSRNPWVRAIAEELQRHHSQAVKEDAKLHLHFPLTVQGEKLFVDVQRYRDEYGLNWLLVVVIPESDFMKAIQTNQQRTWLFFCVALVLGTGVSLLVARLILRPLTQLNQASRALAQRQQPNSPLPNSPIRELNDLAASFSQMALDIDISQTQLQSQNHQLQQFLNAIPFGIRILDRQGHQRYVNQPAIALTDTSTVSINDQGEFITAPQLFITGTTTPYPMEQLPLMQALHGVTHYVEDIEYHQNERVIPLAVWGTPIYNTAGELEYGMVVFQDISERRRTESTLRENEKLFRRYFEQPFLGMAITSPSKGWLKANERLCEMLGYNFEELQHLTWAELTHPEDLAKDVAQFERVLAGEIEGYALEKRFIHKNGQIIDVQLLVYCQRQANGQLDSFVAMLQDISERKQFEQRIQQTNAELLRANRLKDEFLAIMSHELRTPLNAVLGITESLLEEIFGPLNEQQSKSLQTIENSGYHLLNLINDILDLSSISAGKFQLDRVLTAIPPLCQDSLELLQAQASRKQIQLDCHLPPVLPKLLVDERRLRQCLLNLLTNAVKFTPKGGRVSLEVSFPAPRPPLTDAPPYVRFSVIDTGIGIAPEHLEQLFQPFSQVDSRLNRQYEGTGLGLSLVKQMIEFQGGEVGVSSELGSGSCFWIDLPCPEGAGTQ